MPDQQPSAPDQNAPDHTAQPSNQPNDQPATPPPAEDTPRRSRSRPLGRRRLSSLPPVPPRRVPRLGIVSLDIRLNGPEEKLLRMVARLSRELPVNLCIEPYVTLPDLVWEQFPDDFLTQTERSVVREDLRFNSTLDIARVLHLSTGSIISYRSHIRKQFLTIAPELRPAWMEAWMRRYPGRRPDQGDQAEGDAQ